MIPIAAIPVTSFLVSTGGTEEGTGAGETPEAEAKANGTPQYVQKTASATFSFPHRGQAGMIRSHLIKHTACFA
jgi:hypothetical protein